MKEKRKEGRTNERKEGRSKNKGSTKGRKN